jgi:hypothetical protein
MLHDPTLAITTEERMNVLCYTIHGEVVCDNDVSVVLQWCQSGFTVVF